MPRTSRGIHLNPAPVAGNREKRNTVIHTSIMLTEIKIRTFKPSEKSLWLSDERGLYLEVTPNGGRWWRLRYRFGGKEKLISLGTSPDTGLKAARERRDAARKLLETGVDPSKARRAEKASNLQGATNSFEAMAREWHATIHVAQVSSGHAARARSSASSRLCFRGWGVCPLARSRRRSCFRPRDELKRAVRLKQRIAYCRRVARFSGTRSQPGEQKGIQRPISVAD